MGQIPTSEPLRISFASGIEYGLMQTVATLYFLFPAKQQPISYGIIGHCWTQEMIYHLGQKWHGDRDFGGSYACHFDQLSYQLAKMC